MKLRWSLVPTAALCKIVEAYTIGEAKNKNKMGMADDFLVDALHRHLAAWECGEVIDPDDGKQHLGAVGFYVLELLRRDIERAELEAMRCDLMEAFEEHEERGEICRADQHRAEQSQTQSCQCGGNGTGGTT